MEGPPQKDKRTHQRTKHKYIILITDVSIQKLEKPIYFGTKSSNCFRTFPPKRRKDTQQILNKIWKHGKEKLKTPSEKYSLLPCSREKSNGWGGEDIYLIFRWGTLLYMSLFLSVHLSVGLSIRHAAYLRNRTSSDHNIWYTYVKWWYLHAFFSFFQNFDFLGC